jgi:tetratricopeptide (TPR) repeat protein
MASPCYSLRWMLKLSQALLPLTLLLLSSSGCAENKTVPPPNLASSLSASSAVPTIPVQKDDTDHSCSYFYFLWGRHAELENKYNAALEAYEKALICDPDANFVISKLPSLLVRMNRRNEAVTRLRDYLQSHPKEIDARMQLANLLIDDGKLQEAAEQYQQAHELNPKDTAPLLLLSELHLSENKPEQAKAALQDVLNTDSQSYPAHLLLARLLAAEGELRSSLAHYQEAIRLHPSEGLQLEMADVLMQQKKYTKSAKIYKELIAQDEQNEEARIGLIHTYLLQNKETEAMKELERLKELTGNPEQAELTVVKLYIRWEEYHKAIRLLQEILRKEKDFPEARYLLGALQLQEKKYTQALKTLEQISSEAEEYEDGLVLQVRVLKELGRESEAVQRLEAALAKEDENPLSPDVWLLLAGIYQSAEQDTACQKTFVHALAAYPDNEQILYDYGLFLDKSGQKQQAFATMKKLLQLNPDHAGALNYIGYTWAEKKINLSHAFLYLTRAKELKPENASIRDSLGWVYFQMGSFAEAIQSLKEAIALDANDPAVYEHLAAAQAASGRREAAKTAWQAALDVYNKQLAATTRESKRERKRIEKGLQRVKEKLAGLQEKKKK